MHVVHIRLTYCFISLNIKCSPYGICSDSFYCTYKISTLNSYIAKCDKILLRDKTAQRMLYSNSIIYQAIFFFCVSSFNFYSPAFSLQILRFVYSFVIVGVLFLQFMLVFVCWKKNMLEKSMDNLLIAKTDVTQFL